MTPTSPPVPSSRRSRSRSQSPPSPRGPQAAACCQACGCCLLLARGGPSPTMLAYPGRLGWLRGRA
eukprot:3776868-Alexandrium_andersonii.AAC.1